MSAAARKYRRAQIDIITGLPLERSPEELERWQLDRQVRWAYVGLATVLVVCVSAIVLLGILVMVGVLP